MARMLLAAVVLVGCGGAEDAGPPPDRPDALVGEAMLDWTALPEAPTPLGTTLVHGWAAQAAVAAVGVSHQPAAYFRFEEVFEVGEGDVGIRELGGGGEDVPVRWVWIEEPAGDPFFQDRTLVVMPRQEAPLRSGGRYVAWVATSVADPAPGWEAQEGAPADAAAATVFTVQDSLGQAEALAEATRKRLEAAPEVLEPTDWKQVVSLAYAQGKTPSGEDATVATVVYADGGESVTYLAAEPDNPDHGVQLDDSWPHEVWEGRIRTFAFQSQAKRPWASPGLGLLGDFERLEEGWIGFPEGGPEAAAEPEEMRIVVLVPRQAPAGGGALPVVLWDHGTGGHAYNAIARTGDGDDEEAVAAALAGAVVVSRDQPLYGQRYPLIDEGFGASLGFYNIGNLPAFRDNQRQSWVDHWVVREFATQVLPDKLGDGVEIDVTRLGAFGHSLGSVTLHGALVVRGIEGWAQEKAAFMSGSGGYLAYYILESGLLGTGHELVNSVAPLLGLTPEQVAGATPADLIAAIIGLPESAWPNMGPHHPVMQLFGTIMDPSDPLAFALQQTVPETILMGVGDWQVPNSTTRWLAEAHPAATLVECQPTADYDPHVCLFREAAGAAALEAFVESL